MLLATVAALALASPPLYPFTVSHERLRMPDGVELAVTFWRPVPRDSAERFPVLLEYLPYRKDDSFYRRDYPLYEYFVRRGYIMAKVDIRGTGGSQGRLPPREYSDVELSDGCRLAARIFLPEDAGVDPVPAILEFLPYRKRDGTAERDALTHPYFAGHGYAGVRVDMRGSGESDGLLDDEYLKQEQDDALEVIAWLAAQPWCSGSVGMIGISWGGFNALQVAMRRPPALKAILALHASDDLFHDDVHYIDGLLLVRRGFARVSRRA